MKSTMLKMTIAIAALGALAMSTVASAGLLQQIKERGYLECGVSTGLPGFSAPDENGNWSGLDVAFCRAVAAAVFGDAGAVRFTPLTSKQRFVALQTGAIDVLSRNSTWTLSRDAALGLDFIGVMFYDGQGFMVRKKLGIDSIAGLSGATICVKAGTTTAMNVSDWFRAHDLEYNPLILKSASQAITAYSEGRCDVLTSDSSQLAALRTKLENPKAHEVLPQLISKEPLGPAVAEGNQQWSDVVQWVYFALIRAEELGINSDNVKQIRETTDNPKVKRFLGLTGSLGETLGLDDDWAVQIINQVGNYGEIYYRTVGQGSPLGLKRGVNALWTEGGLMYAMPFK